MKKMSARSGAFDAMLARSVTGIDSTSLATRLWVVGGTAILAGSVGYIISITGDMMTALLLFSLIVFALVFSPLILSDWRRGLLFFVMWMMVEDSLRKYTGNIVGIYFAKDAILLTTYFSFFQAKSKSKVPLFKDLPRTTFVGVLFLIVLGLIMALLRSGPGSWIVPVIGLRMWFIYVPLVLLGFDLARSPDHFRKLFLLVGVFGGIVAFFGLLQAFFGNQWLNPTQFAYEAKLFLEKAGPSGFILNRPTSIFIDPGRFGKFIILYACLIPGVATYFLESENDRQRIHVWWLICILLISLAGLLSGARLVIVVLPIAIALFFIIYRLGRTANKSRPPVVTTRFIAVAIVLIAIAAAILYWLRPSQFHGFLDFYSTTVPYMGTHQELHVNDIAHSVKTYGLIGSGIGSGSQGIGYFNEGQPFDYEVETGYATLIIEFGLAGIVLWLIMAISLTTTTIRAALALRATRLFGLAIGVVMSQALFLLFLFYLGSAIYQDYLVSSHVWLFSGLVIGLANHHTAQGDVVNKPIYPSNSGRELIGN